MHMWMKRVTVLWLQQKWNVICRKKSRIYAPGAEVNILIWQKTDLGFKAIIDDMYSGLLYEMKISVRWRQGWK